MRIIKKLDLFVLKAYLQLFAGTFFICLFIFLMQFVWKYVDELVGKGLSWDVLAKFFWYSSLTLIPMSLPLAVLLASLISFGNLGEKFELLSMKAAGIPLVRILQPVLLTSVLIGAGSFYFQNKISPEATKELARLIWSVKQKSPELEIPEGIFYNEIPGYNIYVEKKDIRTGVLYGVMIYSNSNGYQDAEIVLADSARLQSTEDKKYLQLTLYNGERFRNMDAQSGNMLKANIPYMRESFIREVDLIFFDNAFNLMDANLFSGNAQTKNIQEISTSIDSIALIVDSVGHSTYKNTMEYFLKNRLPAGIKDSMLIVENTKGMAPLDSIYNQMDEEQKTSVWKLALGHAETMKSEYEFRAITTADTNYMFRRHKMELQKKFTLSLACLLFFFIGAPLGAIIRKGGLGVPVVISVIIFIFYYIINVAGENNAKTGQWSIASGIWFSSSILLPIGLFLTHKANKDSVVFNTEGYRNFLFRLLGIRMARKLSRKEVIIYNPEYTRLCTDLKALSAKCKEYNWQTHLRRVPNYWKMYFRYQEDRRVIDLNEELEQLIQEMHNSKDVVILTRINEYPILNPDAHTRPFHNARLNILVGILLPIGIFFYFRIWRYRLRLWKDMQKIQTTNQDIIDRIIKQKYE